MARDTGWPVQYIMRKVNYVMLVMMSADAPHYVDKPKKSIIEQFEEMEAEEAGNKKKPGVSPLSYFEDMENEE